MHIVKKCAAQGDLLIRRVDSIPNGLTPVEAEGGKYILSHSETGHHHAVDKMPGFLLFNTLDPLVSFLRVPAGKTVDVIHYRAWDTHAPLRLDSGDYEIRRQREFTPDGWRRVADQMPPHIYLVRADRPRIHFQRRAALNGVKAIWLGFAAIAAVVAWVWR